MPAPAPDRELLAAFRAAVQQKIRRDLAEEEARAAALALRIVPAMLRAVAEARASGACARVWLFGSFAGGAWGKPGERSDVDLLVEGDDEGVAAAVERVAGRPVHALDPGE